MTKWKLLHQDTFDRQAPITCESTGDHLADGLRLLWSKTLREGVTESGAEGFSRFHLSWNDAGGLQNARVATYPAAPLARLRRSVEEDASLLDHLAAAHLRLIEGIAPAARTSSSQESEMIIAAIADAGDHSTLRHRLDGLKRA